MPLPNFAADCPLLLLRCWVEVLLARAAALLLLLVAVRLRCRC